VYSPPVESGQFKNIGIITPHRVLFITTELYWIRFLRGCVITEMGDYENEKTSYYNWNDAGFIDCWVEWMY